MAAQSKPNSPPAPLGDANAPSHEETAKQASQAPENNIQASPLPSQDHDAFAKQWGFESYLALFESSTPLKTSAEGQWQLTNLKTDAWIVWNAADLTLNGRYASEAEAKSSLRP